MSVYKKTTVFITSCPSRQADFETFVATYWEKLLKIAVAKTNEHDAFDIVQDVMMNLWEKWEEAPKDNTLEFYLLNALKFRIYNYYRTNSRYRVHLKKLEILLNETVATHTVLADERWSGLKETIIKEALDTLTPNQQQLFMLRVSYHYSYRKIALQLNINPVSARVLYYRALKQVKAHILSNPELSVSLIATVWMFTIC